MHVSNKFLLTLFCFSIMQYPPASHTMGLPLSPLSLWHMNLKALSLWHWAVTADIATLQRCEHGSELADDHHRAAQIPGGELQIRHHCYIRTGQGRQEGATAEIFQAPASLSPGHFWWKVRDLGLCQYTLLYPCVRFVLKGVNYNPVEVMNVLSSSRGYKLEGEPQQRTLPSIHIKDDK